MSKMFQSLLTIILTAALVWVSGCYGASITTPAHSTGAQHRDTGVSWFWGLTTTGTHATQCRNGLAYAHTYFPWWAYVVQFFTLGVVTPITKVYTCVASGPATAPGAPVGDTGGTPHTQPPAPPQSDSLPAGTPPPAGDDSAGGGDSPPPPPGGTHLEGDDDSDDAPSGPPATY
jgi:hypothetical protein